MKSFIHRQYGADVSHIICQGCSLFCTSAAARQIRTVQGNTHIVLEKTIFIASMNRRNTETLNKWLKLALAQLGGENKTRTRCCNPSGVMQSQ